MIAKLQSYDWANPEQAIFLWLALAALLWGGAKGFWGMRWQLPLAPSEKAPLSWPGLAAPIPRLLRFFGLALLILALMRPQTVRSQSESSVQSIDIYLALDVSDSMHADDAQPDRLGAAQAALKRFVDAMPGDRIGMVVFAGKAFTQCPLSLDHGIVKYFIDKVRLNSFRNCQLVGDGTIAIGGTAMGDGLLLSVQRLIQEPKAGQVIVVATDGRSNTGQEPFLAAQIAAQAGIKVYTVGIGAKGGGFVRCQLGGREYKEKQEEPDEALMARMADTTGGRYFRATDEKSLAQAYAQIAQMERRETKVKNRREADDHFYPFLLWGAALLLVEALLRLRLRVVM